MSAVAQHQLGVFCGVHHGERHFGDHRRHRDYERDAGERELRRREIGVRRAVGATNDDILRQFMVESVMQCIGGGIAGMSTGIPGGAGFANLHAFPGFRANLGRGAGSVCLSSVVGLFFGIYPAVRASQLDPVVALRSD